MTDAPSSDEFTIWLESPVTQFVMAGFERLAALQQVSWSQAAWAGNLDPLYRERCLVRADDYDGFAHITFEQAMKANGIETDDVEDPRAR
jgi:hypothetical protein